NEAIVEEMGNYFLFVKVHDGEYEKRIVTLGETDGLRTEIKNGLQVGDVIVTTGASMVRLAQNSSTLDPHAGHVH
ncbi:MAG: efflux transporter periplasmic adaptor subunit, partial [Bacteroidales bacterium]|nr:efflux transporter periplasmic adaptor subunit [Bacteroidales bacterium]